MKIVVAGLVLVASVNIGAFAAVKPEQKAAAAAVLGSEASVLEAKNKEGAAKAALGALRNALTMYFGDHQGKYPETLTALVPKYIKAIPVLELPGYKATSEVTLAKAVSSSFYGVDFYADKSTNTAVEAKKEQAAKELLSVVSDIGGWLYFPQTGEVCLNAKKVSVGSKKMEYCKY
ncbi:MAG TPA: hypothetical protein PLL10_03720 [Elusimicrobiales bacterium]|nr:hypothetical protein [Elusimicrobiales bacterium]